MTGSAHFKFNIGFPFYFDNLFSGSKIFPLTFKLYLVRILWINSLDKEIGIIVFKHGKSPTGISVIAQQSERNTGYMMPVKTFSGIFEVCLIPHRRLAEPDVCIIF